MIPSADVNVGNDIAYCRACNLSYRLSELTLGAELDSGVDVQNPPDGTWYRRDGTEIVIGSTLRSWGTALGALAFGLFWNGITSVFVLVNISATMHNLHIPVPDWFPAPKMNGDDMGLGMTLFLWIFLTPFITVGLCMIGAFLLGIGGRTELRILGEQGTIFMGIGPLGYRRRFDTRDIKDVRIDNKSWNNSDGDRQSRIAIVIETGKGKLLQFGTMLRQDRRKFVASAARKTLLGR